MSLNNTVKRNLFFKVDFDGKYTKTKKGIKQKVKFFLIGTLPIVIEYKDGKKERSILNIPLEVKKDPYLRLLHGARFEHLKEIKKVIKEKFKVDVDYNVEAKDIVDKTQLAIKKIVDSGKFMDKEIKSILIINITKKEYEQSKNNQK